MKKLSILLVSILIFVSCSSDDDISSEVNIRLSNVSSLNYENIVVNTSTGNVDFESINTGEKTDYKTFQTAYRYAFIKLQIAGEMYIFQPFDYVGETPLKNGNYTYELTIDEASKSVQINFIKD